MIVRFRDAWALPLAGLLAVAGVLHFVAPENFDSIVPHILPGSGRFWTSVSGVAELCLAVGVAWPVTRRIAATASAVFFVLVFPANIQDAVDHASGPTPELVLALLRLPLQIPLIWWAWHVRTRSAAPRTPAATVTTSPP